MESSNNLIIVSGMSGAGRSSVANVLEDLGWFVVDNLPPMFLATMIEQLVETGAAPRLAVVVDVPGPGGLASCGKQFHDDFHVTTSRFP